MEGDLKPAAIFQPKTTGDVSNFIKVVKPFTERGETKFAIHGAGQQPTPRCANIDGGIMLDLSLLTGVELKNDDKTVSVAAGERWGAVYENLEGTGLLRNIRGGIGG